MISFTEALLTIGRTLLAIGLELVATKRRPADTGIQFRIRTIEVEAAVAVVVVETISNVSAAAEAAVDVIRVEAVVEDIIDKRTVVFVLIFLAFFYLMVFSVLDVLIK